MSCYKFIYDDNYADFLIDYNYDINEIYRRYNPECVNILSNKYAVIYKNINESGVFDNDRFSFNVIGYDSFPKLYTVLDNGVEFNNKDKVEFLQLNGDEEENQLYNSFIDRILTESGISQLRRFEGFDITGRDVLIGFIDTGINYSLDIFKFEDGGSKISAIWDQSIMEGINGFEGENLDFSNSMEIQDDKTFFGYGRVYDNNEINQAINVENPLDIVKSVDSNGHGTSLASLASSIATDANLVIVKLKEAKNSLKNFYGINESTLCYAESDIMAGGFFF